MTTELKPLGYVLKTGHGNSFRETLDGVAPELRHLWIAVDRRTEPAGSAEPQLTASGRLLIDALAQLKEGSTGNGELPPLPEPEFSAWFGTAGGSTDKRNGYTADQMRDYARAALSTQSTHQPDVSIKAGESDKSEAFDNAIDADLAITLGKIAHDHVWHGKMRHDVGLALAEAVRTWMLAAKGGE